MTFFTTERLSRKHYTSGLMSSDAEEFFDKTFRDCTKWFLIRFSGGCALSDPEKLSRCYRIIFRLHPWRSRWERRENRNDEKQTQKIENKIKTNNIVKNCLQLIISLLQVVFVVAVVVAKRKYGKRPFHFRMIREGEVEWLSGDKSGGVGGFVKNYRT